MKKLAYADLMIERVPLGLWTREAECKVHDPDLFDSQAVHETIEAKRICNRCPVQVACLEHAIHAKEKGGIWGGKSQPERDRYAHDLAMAARKRRSVDRELGSEEDL